MTGRTNDGSGGNGPDGTGGASEWRSDGGGAGGSNDGGDGGDEPTGAERAVTVLSALLTVAVFTFAAWQAVTASTAAPPAVRVVGAESAPNGDLVVTVELANEGDVGLRSATVEVPCTDPPVEVEFLDVPVDGRRTGQVRCPPGTGEPNVSVVSWIER